MGDSTFNNGRVSSVLGTGLLFRDCMAVLCEGGVFDGCDTGLAF